jgi:hypothetical protein
LWLLQSRPAPSPLPLRQPLTITIGTTAAFTPTLLTPTLATAHHRPAAAVAGGGGSGGAGGDCAIGADGFAAGALRAGAAHADTLFANAPPTQDLVSEAFAGLAAAADNADADTVVAGYKVFLLLRFTLRGHRWKRELFKIYSIQFVLRMSFCSAFLPIKRPTSTEKVRFKTLAV